VLVLRSVVDEQQEARVRQALHQGVEQRLSLAIDPVKVLAQDHEGLDLGLPEQQPLDPVERALAPLRRFQPLPLEVLDRDVQEPEEGRQGGLEHPIQRQELADHLLPDLARIVAGLDLEVGS
jgi:hypothetical protein